ncbi:MAG: hypothetical protein ACXVNF_02915 [Neobacillus sp.]
MNNEILKNSVYQSLNEISDAIFYLYALIGMSKAKKENNILFLKLASDALKNDIMSRLIKVLDKTRNTGSFWYIYEQEMIDIDNLVIQELIDFNAIKALCNQNRLYKIRNKIHCHLDKDYTFNQADAWQEANISTKEIKIALESLHRILRFLFEKYEGKPFPVIDYDGTDAAAVVDVANTYIQIK